MPQSPKDTRFNKMVIPRTPDKGSNPPTFHDWQAKEMIAEARTKRTQKRNVRRGQARK